jgi:hypothetical protein
MVKRIRIAVGAERSFRAFHLSDTHIVRADATENDPRKVELAARRYPYMGFGEHYFDEAVHLARMEVPARGMRRLADGVRAADGMTALAFAAKHTPKTLRSPQKRARPSEGSVAFPKGGDIPDKTPH